MKKWFVILIFGLANAQQPSVEILKIETVDKIISASIESKYAITMYLKMHQVSDDHLGIYSVKGWYHYDNKKIKIPLVGIYDGDLTLYNFRSAERLNEILTFQTPRMADSVAVNNIWDKLDILKDLDGYDEKFSIVIEDNIISGKWQKDNRELHVTVFHDEKLDVFDEIEYLQIKDKDIIRTINTRDLDLFTTGLRFEAYKKTKDEVRILLSFEHGSNPNIQGRCGAAIEAGYITLHFDRELNYLSHDYMQTESCHNSIYEQNADPRDPNLIILSMSENKTEKWRLDLPNAQIIKLK